MYHEFKGYLGSAYLMCAQCNKLMSYGEAWDYLVKLKNIELLISKEKPLFPGCIGKAVNE